MDVPRILAELVSTVTADRIQILTLDLEEVLVPAHQRHGYFLPPAPEPSGDFVLTFRCRRMGPPREAV